MTDNAEQNLLKALKENKLKPDAVDDEGCNAIMIGINRYFSTSTIEQFIKYKVPLNQKNENVEDGTTALHNAFTMENLEVFEILLKNGADPTIADADGDIVQQLVEEPGKDKYKDLVEKYWK